MTPAHVLYQDGIAAEVTGRACPDCPESEQGYFDSLFGEPTQEELDADAMAADAMDPLEWEATARTIEMVRWNGSPLSPYQMGFLDASEFEPFQPSSYYAAAWQRDGYAVGYNDARPFHAISDEWVATVYEQHEQDRIDNQDEMEAQRYAGVPA